jgi:SAM-dependent methyltransferase
MTTFDLIVDLHKNIERQGPGSNKATLTALSFMDLPADRKLNIVDIGCGTGAPTISLAKNLNAQILAVDLFPAFLTQLEKRAEQLGLKNKISTLQASMDALPFEKESFDVLWSEGAIYNIGFQKGIEQWKDYLKGDGYLAVSEITWITNTRPAEIDLFWRREYPEIDKASVEINILESNGFTLTGYFYLSHLCWEMEYYKPLELAFKNFLQRHNHSNQAQKLVSESQAEIELYRKYKDFYSYGFYIARKNK